jgi:uncharacterized membrane protein YdbT with pleckstrin-like domain
MGFTESLLSTGERVVHTEKQHWFVFVWGARLTIAAIILAIVFYILGGNLPQDGAGGAFRTILGWATLVLFIGGLANLAWTILSYMNHAYVITNRRVLQVSGVLNKTSADSSLEKINDAVLTQSIFGRIFGFGDLEVLTASDVGIDRFRMIVDPIGFKKAMLDAKHEFEVDMEREGWQPSPPVGSGSASARSASPAQPAMTSASDPTTSGPTPAAASVAPAAAAASRDLTPDQLTRTLANLADLRDRGAISAEEYEAKKADLLGRL